MLYFCEDCGARNMIAEKEMNAGAEDKFSFRCTSCNYLNTVTKSGQDSTTTKPTSPPGKAAAETDK